MKNIVISLLLIGTLFSVTLSVTMMNHMDNQGHSLCPFGAAGITNCDQVRNFMEFITSHLNAFARFSLAVPVNNFAVSLIALLILVFSVPIIFSRELKLFTPKSIFAQIHLRESFTAPKRLLFNHWFSLHENSPAFLMGRR